MAEIKASVKRIVWEVAEECKLPLELDKEETLHLRKSGKTKNVDRKYVKWLGVIFDDSLDFDMHWKSRLAKARPNPPRYTGRKTSGFRSSVIAGVVISLVGTTDIFV